MTNLRIAIVGSGILGASLAWHLALKGASVRLFEAGARPASGVTGHAFGWVNLINSSPDTDPVAYRMRSEGIDDYRRLMRQLPEAFADARPGSLMWLETPEETEALVATQRVAGTKVELVDAATIAGWEPHLRAVPPCAAYSPDDLALSPTALTETLARAAEAAGAVLHLGESVVAVETGDGRVTGVRTASGSLPADIVVLAAGVATGELASALGADIGVESSPAVLLRYSASAPFITGILRGPGLEVRQWHDHSLFVAAGHRPGEDARAIGERALERITKRFDTLGAIALTDAVIGQRPTFSDDLPRLGFLPGIEGAYVAVGHPGIILAPLMGRLAAEEIIGGVAQSLIAAPARIEAEA